MRASETIRTATSGGLFLLALAAGVLSGCSRKAESCRAVISAVNEGTGRLSAFEAERQRRPSGGAAQTAQDMRKLGGVYDQNAAALDPAGFSDRELAFRAGEYGQTSKNAAEAARTLASALDTQEHARAAEAEALLTRAVNDQRATVERINAYCAP